MIAADDEPARARGLFRVSKACYAGLFRGYGLPVICCILVGIVGVVFGSSIYTWLAVAPAVQVVSIDQDCSASTSTLYLDRASGEPVVCARTDWVPPPGAGSGPERPLAPDFPYPDHRGEILRMAADFASDGAGLSQAEEQALRDHVISIAYRTGRADATIRDAIPMVSVLPLALGLLAAPAAAREQLREFKPPRPR